MEAETLARRILTTLYDELHIYDSDIATVAAVIAPEINHYSPNDYQQDAARTLIAKPDAEYTGDQIMLVWNAMGLAGEAGEVADTIKKAVFHQHGIDRDKLIKELGDVLWYVAALCTKLDTSMSEVMDRNIAKLIERYPEGYSSDASKARVDVL